MRDCENCLHSETHELCTEIGCPVVENIHWRIMRQAAYLIIMCIAIAVFFKFGVKLREAQHAQSGVGTVMDGAIVYYGHSKPSPAEMQRLVEAYK